MSAATRTAVLWVPDWPVVAALAEAGLDAHVPAAVLGAPSGGGTRAGRSVVATSAVARTAGVRRGMRRRQAQEACPDLVLLEVDDARDARTFEPVATAAETVVAGLEIARPGLVLLPADGAARFHGSERALAERLVAAVADAGHECQVGVADGLLAAVLAAREDAVVPPGGSAAALAGRGVGELVHAVCDPGVVASVRDAVGLWRRLGLHTLGDLAALPAASVAARFGDLGTWAHRLARGEDERPPARRRIEADLAVATDLDPPADRVDVAAFAARRLAEELHALLVAHGLACARLRITARTAGGELERLWRTDAATGGLDAARITDRVRWQLEGWLTDSSLRRTGTGASPHVEPVVHLALAAEDVAPAGTHQPSLWGPGAGGDTRARQALDRVQGLLGGDAVLAVRLQGGRDARSRVRLVPYGEEATLERAPDRPWPGALPSPAPATVLPDPSPAVVLDAAARDVVVDTRLAMSGEPARVRWGDDEHAVVGWAGPWPLAERWWTPAPVRRVQLQVVLDDGRGLLLAQTAGAWTVEALYD